MGKIRMCFTKFSAKRMMLKTLNPIDLENCSQRKVLCDD